MGFVVKKCLISYLRLPWLKSNGGIDRVGINIEVIGGFVVAQ
jgi:hypothetical protein